jgi:hypothetical protein
MKLLSTGELSTLGVYRDYCNALFGPESKATKFFDVKIAESPNGRDEEVIADESQMMHLIMHQMRGEAA